MVSSAATEPRGLRLPQTGTTAHRDRGGADIACVDGQGGTMSTIEVKPADARQVRRSDRHDGGSLSAVYLMAVIDYIDDMAIEDTGSRVFAEVYAYNDQVMNLLRADTLHISRLLVASGSALSSSADAYRQVDEAARERYDGQYVPAGASTLTRRSPPGKCGGPRFCPHATRGGCRRGLRPDRQDHLVDRLDLHLRCCVEAGRALRTAPDGPADGGDLRRLRLRRSRRWRARGSRISWRAFVGWTCRRQREVFERGGPPVPTDAELDALLGSD